MIALLEADPIQVYSEVSMKRLISKWFCFHQNISFLVKFLYSFYSKVGPLKIIYLLFNIHFINLLQVLLLPLYHPSVELSSHGVKFVLLLFLSLFSKFLIFLFIYIKWVVVLCFIFDDLLFLLLPAEMIVFSFSFHQSDRLTFFSAPFKIWF